MAWSCRAPPGGVTPMDAPTNVVEREHAIITTKMLLPGSGPPKPTQPKPTWMSGRIPDRFGTHPRYIANSSTLPTPGGEACWNRRCIEDVSPIFQGFGLTSKSV